jgi:hypothetical protein
MIVRVGLCPPDVGKTAPLLVSYVEPFRRCRSRSGRADVPRHEGG